MNLKLNFSPGVYLQIVRMFYFGINTSLSDAINILARVKENVKAIFLTFLSILFMLFIVYKRSALSLSGEGWLVYCDTYKVDFIGIRLYDKHLSQTILLLLFQRISVIT